MRSQRISFSACFLAIYLASGLFPGLRQPGFASLAWAIEDTSAAHGGGSPTADDWIEVDLVEKTRILEVLVAKGSANYDKIDTWSGTYAQHFETGFGPEMRGKPGVPSNTNIHATFDSICRFAVDVKANHCFLAVEEGKQSYQNIETHQPIKDHPSRILVERCILTPENYVSFQPDQTLSDLTQLFEHKLPPRRVANVDVPKRGQLSLFGDFVDPRQFFHITGNVKAWGEYEAAFLPAFQGKRGDDVRNRLDQMLAVSRAAKNGELWYRVKWQNRKGRRLKEYLHASSVGFNVVQAVAGPDDSPTHIYQFQYKLIDDVYVPSKVVVQYDNLQAVRTLGLRECVLNQPIPPAQFSFSALGLGDGDLIMNNIEKVAYQFTSGKPIRFSAYGEPPAAAKPDSLQSAP